MENMKHEKRRKHKRILTRPAPREAGEGNGGNSNVWVGYTLYYKSQGQKRKKRR